MIIAPFKSVDVLNGFIHKYHIDYEVSASSTNYNEERKFNPLTSSTDRWCSQSRGRPGEWYMINFTKKKLYISHFVLWNFEGKNYNLPISWYAEGCNEEKCYNLTTYNKESIGTKEVFKTDVHGPFNAFKYTSTGKDSNDDYHHCVAKLEIFGATSECIKRRFSCVIRHKIKNKFILILITIIMK